MKLFTVSSLLALPTALAMPSLVGKSDPFSNWKPAGPGDVRAPCPMLNTLANHGFLNHDGKNINRSQIEYAFNTYLNINTDLASNLFGIAVNVTVPNPNATTFDLDDLSRHNLLEHDGSLSRKDFYFGDNHDFDARTFDQTKAYFTSDKIVLQQAVDARLARMYTSNATNPTFNISDLGAVFSFGETGAYLLIFQDGGFATANRHWVEYFFKNERLPTSLGWTGPSDPVTGDVLDNMINTVINATGGSFPYPVPTTPNTGKSSSAKARAVRGFHGDW